MPGYVIHLAAANAHLANFDDVRDRDAFYEGVIAPDLRHPKDESHFGKSPSHSNPDLYLDTIDTLGDFELGYYYHLLTDHLFYRRFMENVRWIPAIYDDYDRLNGRLIEAYGVIVPEKVRHTVGSRDDAPVLLDYEAVCGFIDTVGAIDLEELMRTHDYAGLVIRPL